MGMLGLGVLGYLRRCIRFGVLDLGACRCVGWVCELALGERDMSNIRFPDEGHSNEAGPEAGGLKQSIPLVGDI